MENFTLHERLAADTVPLGDLPLCRVLLMRNQLFPWLILVPRRAGAIEIHRLSVVDQMQLTHETSAAAQVLEHLFQPDKINTGALGNMVSQLHIHVIARRRDDPAWPGPVWGSGQGADYAEGEAERLAAAVWRELARFDG
ncbi:HIT domain-containing protein [Niveispirillum sp. SYP-B3756]|uniref:HIT domain-containing protein n=1 Tax=Niveispirillum sp. SYP-B3756 TaxID=2662178 RepID=UPI00129222E8|nr:HIT family protein [Niveispirillum sp. SYP-B3756]MQP65204.1 HIT domain-containing protein [Niveispirillum sp. SYP-B3756]